MLKRIRRGLVGWRERQGRGERAQSGQSLIILAFAFLGLIALLGLALDLGLVYIERVRVKRAVDASALAGVVELPYEEDAFTRSIEYLTLNGYTIDPVSGDANVLVKGCVEDPAHPGTFIDHTTPYTYVQVANPRATFILAAEPPPGATRSGACDPGTSTFGNANRLAVTGTVTVNMNFMQFFGFRTVPVMDWAVAQNVTDLDVVVVFDTSGSMEFGTICYDCWVRSNATNPDYPNNGYYNPIPSAVLTSTLCSATQVPYVDGANRYLIAEGELAAFNPPLWRTRYRQTGQGYWAIQRGSRNGDRRNNRAGDPAQQSSNPCQAAGINCTVPGNPSDNLCANDPGTDVQVDCSAYISHHPFATYGQGSPPAELLGMFYYLADVTDNDPPPPKIEYDFTPNWSGTTHIWIRAQGGGSYSFEPTYVSPFDQNKNTIHWDVLSATDGFNPATNTSALGVNNWRDNRAEPGNWRWLHLGTTTATAGQTFVLRLWPGSPGYDVDKIVVTNDTRTTASTIPALSYDTPATDIGRPATPGSATRAACDPCNPIYGLNVTPGQCTGYSPVLTPTNHLADPLFGDLEPIRTSQEAVKRFIKRLDPEFDQAGFVPFTTGVVRAGQSQLECRKRDGESCYEPVGGNPPISYTVVLGQVENNTAQDSTNIAWGMLEGLKSLGVNVHNQPQCTGGQNPFDNSCFDNRCTSDHRTGCGRGGAATKVMVVLTDGSPNENPQSYTGVNCGNDPVYNFPSEVPDSSDYDCVIYYAGKALQSNVIVYTIGLGDGANGDLLGMAADVTRGRYYFALTPAELDAIFDEILSNIYVRLIR